MLKSTPIRIHIDPSAIPVAVKTAATIPLHLHDQVKTQLNQDLVLGTIERVPKKTTTRWLVRMHGVSKPY